MKNPPTKAVGGWSESEDVGCEPECELRTVQTLVRTLSLKERRTRAPRMAPPAGRAHFASGAWLLSHCGFTATDPKHGGNAIPIPSDLLHAERVQKRPNAQNRGL